MAKSDKKNKIIKSKMLRLGLKGLQNKLKLNEFLKVSGKNIANNIALLAVNLLNFKKVLLNLAAELGVQGPFYGWTFILWPYMSLLDGAFPKIVTNITGYRVNDLFNWAEGGRYLSAAASAFLILGPAYVASVAVCLFLFTSKGKVIYKIFKLGNIFDYSFLVLFNITP